MKKHLLKLFAIALALIFSGYTSKHSSKSEDFMWFLYESGPVFLPTSYIVDDNQTEFGCDAMSGSVTTCRILVPFTEIWPGLYIPDLFEIIWFGSRQGNGYTETSVRLKNSD